MVRHGLILSINLSSAHHHIVMIFMVELLKYKRKYTLVFVYCAFIQTDHYLIENGMRAIIDIGNQGFTNQLIFTIKSGNAILIVDPAYHLEIVF